MFVGMAQMFLPDLSGLTLTPGSPPVRLPETMVPVPGVVTHAAMSDAAIGLSVGDGEEAGLPGFLDEKAGPKGTFFSASYDMQTYMEYQDMVDQHVHANVPADNDHGPALDAAMAIGEAAEQVLEETTDRNSVTMKLTADGFAIEGRSTFR